MNRQDRESPWLTVLKVLAALVLVLMALAFGAGGACGVVMAVGSLWDSISRRASGSGGYAVIGAILGAVGLGVAGLLVWGVVLMFRRNRDRDE